MEGIAPKLLKIETENRELRERVLGLEAKHEELSRKANNLSYKQPGNFISFAITMAVTVLGAVYYQTSVLDKRLDQVEKRLEQRIDQVDARLNSRMDQVEKT